MTHKQDSNFLPRMIYLFCGTVYVFKAKKNNNNRNGQIATKIYYLQIDL